MRLCSSSFSYIASHKVQENYEINNTKQLVRWKPLESSVTVSIIDFSLKNALEGNSEAIIVKKTKIKSWYKRERSECGSKVWWSSELTIATWSTRNHGNVNLGEAQEGLDWRTCKLTLPDVTALHTWIITLRLYTFLWSLNCYLNMWLFPRIVISYTTVFVWEPHLVA